LKEREVSDEETHKLILEKRKEGKVCFMAWDGLHSVDVVEFIKQPAEGILYDLNRDIPTTLTIMPEKRWVNDLAVAVTIVALKNEIEGLLTAMKVIADSKDGAAVAFALLHNRSLEEK
jgi:hypothetical protein